MLEVSCERVNRCQRSGDQIKPVRSHSTRCLSCTSSGTDKSHFNDEALIIINDSVITQINSVKRYHMNGY